MQWIQELAEGQSKDTNVHNLLEHTTIYAFPRLNPDAAESYFARPRVERTTNRTPTDDDHDGLVDEDGPEDLNGDGLITNMRIEDPEGEFILDSVDSRLLIKADKAKGKKGAWRLLPEGIDNDKDDQWNEDDVGGVNLNRNFPYNYAFFGADSGWHQVSEPERAPGATLVAHPNIAAAFDIRRGGQSRPGAQKRARRQAPPRRALQRCRRALREKELGRSTEMPSG